LRFKFSSLWIDFGGFDLKNEISGGFMVKFDVFYWFLEILNLENAVSGDFKLKKLQVM
jgi:hypothetical protein